MLYDPQVLVTAIKERRLALKLSQGYVASRLDISQNGYSKLELGYTNLSLDRFIAICEVLDMEVLDMLRPALLRVA